MKLGLGINTIPISVLKGALITRPDGSEMGYLGDITLDIRNMIVIVDLIDFKDHKSRTGLMLNDLLEKEDYRITLNGSPLEYRPSDNDDIV